MTPFVPADWLPVIFAGIDDVRFKRLVTPGDVLELTCDLERVRGLSAIAEARGQTLAQMALLWTLRNPGVTSALIGASSVKQLEDNIAAIHGPDFEPEELEAIDVFAVHGTDSGSHRKS